jgi:hypothetical protein
MKRIKVNVKRRMVRFTAVGVMLCGFGMFIHAGIYMSSPSIVVVNGIEGRSYTMNMVEK